jgi:hypothetical protein
MEKSVAEILGGVPEEPQEQASKIGATPVSAGAPDLRNTPSTKSEARRRVRQKMRSTPVVGGGLFGESIHARSGRESQSKFSDPIKSKDEDLVWESAGGVPAKISVNGQLSTFEFHRAPITISKRDSTRFRRIRGVEIQLLPFKLQRTKTHQSLKCCKVSFEKLHLIRSKKREEIKKRVPNGQMIWDIH